MDTQFVFSLKSTISFNVPLVGQLAMQVCFKNWVNLNKSLLGLKEHLLKAGCIIKYMGILSRAHLGHEWTRKGGC